MQTLRDAKCGDTVTVVKLHGEGAVKRRIMDMGLSLIHISMYIRDRQWYDHERNSPM